MKLFRNKKSRFFRLIFFLVLLHITFFVILKIIVCVVFISNSSSLSQLIVTGKRFYTTDNDIRQSVLSTISVGTVMKQDIHLIQKKIKCFPWIKQVSVRKQWPDKLKIYILEYIPVAYWNCIYMITEDAVIFTVPDRHVHQESFPSLFGPNGSEQYVLSKYYIFNKILQSSGFKINSVSLNSRYSWEIILQDDVKLILGRKNDIVTRLHRFIKIYPIFLSKYYIGKDYEYISYIDLRYKSGFSVKTVPITQNTH